MAQKKINLSEYDPDHVPTINNCKIAIVVSEWNTEVTFALRDGALETLLKQGVKTENIMIKYAPGSYELPVVAEMIYRTHDEIEAIICLGCVIQGETRHFDFICDATANAIMNVSINYSSPVIFGVLTTNDMQQALDRAGGKHGNKGVEAAVACLKMIALERSL
ncbi:MAG: 6,7-dimethyl-8-ribityllumazine synthase [Bacteroidales bacterium]|nr:6,7-dimethyl-8-ribityllumazine synthase [Bacteroidales bacterium]MDD4574870.1 6,7-dimethyl-8-ribityllumazine synthase [Bacteroidales bacterium]